MPLYSASRKQKARAHSSSEAGSSAASSASEAMLIREVLLFTGLEVRTELLLDSAAARVMYQTRHLSTTVLWVHQLDKRGVVTVGALAHRLRELRQWNGLVLDRIERLATGDREMVKTRIKFGLTTNSA